MAKKFRYIMCGMFCGTDGEQYEINLPSHLMHDTEAKAMVDGNFGYRFVWFAGSNEPEIIVYERENFEVIEDGGGKHLKQWVEGNVVKIYTFDEFKAVGGYIRMLKPELKGCGYIDAETDFLDTNKTFLDVFLNMQKQKLYYIDHLAYSIETIEDEF